MTKPQEPLRGSLFIGLGLVGFMYLVKKNIYLGCNVSKEDGTAYKFGTLHVWNDCALQFNSTKITSAKI